MKDLYDMQERERITRALEDMKAEAGESFSLEKVNLSELERRCGVSRMRLRRLKKNNFEFKPHGNTGKTSPQNGLTGYTGILDALLMSGVTNSVVCLERLQKAGFLGGLTAVKMYIATASIIANAEDSIKRNGFNVVFKTEIFLGDSN